MALTGKTIKLNNKYYTYITVFIKVFYVNCTVKIQERIYFHLKISWKLCLTTTRSTYPRYIMLQPVLAAKEASLEACTNTQLALAAKEASLEACTNAKLALAAKEASLEAFLCCGTHVFYGNI